jgi:hypothetical protein
MSLQYKHKISTLPGNIKFICTRLESSSSKFYFCRKFTYIDYAVNVYNLLIQLRVIFLFVARYTVKPVLRGHLTDTEKVVL